MAQPLRGIRGGPGLSGPEVPDPGVSPVVGTDGRGSAVVLSCRFLPTYHHAAAGGFPGGERHSGPASDPRARRHARPRPWREQYQYGV